MMTATVARGVSFFRWLADSVSMANHMNLPNQTPGVATRARARSAPMGMARGAVGPWFRRVTILSILLSVVGSGIGLLAACLRLFPDPLTPGRHAYDRGERVAAARSAREILKTHQGDPAALRLLARSSVNLAMTTRRSGFTPRASRPSRSRPMTTCSWVWC
jgi:hypothetical protein